MKKILLVFVLFSMVMGITACGNNIDDHDGNNGDNPEVHVQKSQETYLKGKPEEFTVYKYETNIAGPTIFIIGGIHGDERAGWHAATQMLDYSFERGTTYVLPVANVRAATSNPPRRFATGVQTDLNRAFPGNKDGTETQKLAYEIFNVIANLSPDLVIDCHESIRNYRQNRLGDSVILHDKRQLLYLLDVVLEQFNALPLNEGEINFTNLDSPPEGSINRTLTDEHGIPVFTLETTRGIPQSQSISIENETRSLELRVEQQLALIDIILKTFNV